MCVEIVQKLHVHDKFKSKFCRLPVPALISDKSKTEEHPDDPKKHGGRKRSFPHKRGDWSTFVYLPCKYEILKVLYKYIYTCSFIYS